MFDPPSRFTFVTCIILHACLTVLNRTLSRDGSRSVKLFSDAAVFRGVPGNVSVAVDAPTSTPVVFDNPFCFSVPDQKDRMVDNSVLRFTSECFGGIRRWLRRICDKVWCTDGCDDRFFEDNFLDSLRIWYSVVGHSGLVFDFKEISLKASVGSGSRSGIKRIFNVKRQSSSINDQINRRLNLASFASLSLWIACN